MKKLDIADLKRRAENLYNSQMFWIRAGVIGIWCIVFLLLGVKSILSEYAKYTFDVYVEGGWVDVSGSDVNVDEVRDDVAVHGIVTTW